ncbi:Hpt domain-containing protein [Breoghania sp.]|uniref:Hpt domain-containing protein n=1 Tax=Breoghania sp. TaxID=2065378 RepID=UPI0026120479|nr:Hpt domain-containing protein [Breoghania sp.]MDJ0932730.1 Hpt domain-containing protein [Breoghania sp.]
MNDRAADGDFEIITPPVNLRSKVRQLGAREAANFDPVAAAEAALAKLSTIFNSWMDLETEDLLKSWVDIHANGLNEERRDTLFRHFHDIKGQAATLGFPLAGRVADSLCHLLDTVTDVKLVPEQLIEQHVQANPRHGGRRRSRRGRSGRDRARQAARRCDGRFHRHRSAGYAVGCRR